MRSVDKGDPKLSQFTSLHRPSDKCGPPWTDAMNDDTLLNHKVGLLVLLIAISTHQVASGQGSIGAASAADAVTMSRLESAFQETIRPFLKTHCLRCHNVDNMKSGIRVDGLTSEPEDRQLFLWKDIQKQVAEGAMPPADEPQPSADLRKGVEGWITQMMSAARSRDTKKNGSIRRLTVTQYRNTLRDLLGLTEDLTEGLPPDGTSKDGFTNNAQILGLSPLQVEAYFEIAEKALDLCIVDESSKPVIENFRMEFGKAINSMPCPDKLILGANSDLLNNEDFVVHELRPNKPFEYQPFVMRTAYDFIEGYVGNDTIRAWKKFDSIYHSVFACVRGTPGYPKGKGVQVIPDGLLLRPAIPSPEIFGQSNTYGPMANFKISLRELPDGGNFRVTVKAARYRDGLLLESGVPACAGDPSDTLEADISTSTDTSVEIKNDGIYQLDFQTVPGKSQGTLSLELDGRFFSGQLLEQMPKTDVGADLPLKTAFLVIRLTAGVHKLSVRHPENSRLRRVIFTRLPDGAELARRFQIFESRIPSLGVYLGLRRDCGSTLTQVMESRPIPGTDLQDFVFEGAIRDFPNPDVEKDNVNYLAGIREIGVRSEFTDGRDMPRLLVSSVEFEGPYFSQWPPATHQNIFIASANRSDLAVYAKEIIRHFAARAFRRPVTEAELAPYLSAWTAEYAARGDFRQSVKESLLMVLTSPQFLFLIENSQGPEAEDLDSYELASKLSYFLWNTIPDQRLLDLASAGKLHQSLDGEVERMIRDPRFSQFVNEFGGQWLSLEKFDVVAIDSRRYPRLTRDARRFLRQEPVQFLRYLIEQNLPARHLIQSEFIIANEVVASYYGLANRTESGFQFTPITHDDSNLGGLLTQAAILAGLSDGRESNPIKRGAWMARKIVAEPPDDPPPNVPQLEDDGAKLSLREKLERHRNQKGCAKCHSGIDPWGIPFESFDAGGLFKSGVAIDGHSTLPDGKTVKDLNELKQHLTKDRMDQVAFSFMKHLACYAVGRSLTYNEILFLQEQGNKLRFNDYKMQDMIRFIVNSDLFLKK